MEWDQITKGWAAMTHRLRGKTFDSPRNLDRMQGARRTTKRGDGDVSETTTVETTGNDRNLQSHL